MIIPSTSISSPKDVYAAFSDDFDPGLGDEDEKSLFLRDFEYYYNDYIEQGYDRDDAVYCACESAGDEAYLEEGVNDFLNYLGRYLIEYTEFTMRDGDQIYETFLERTGQDYY